MKKSKKLIKSQKFIIRESEQTREIGFIQEELIHDFYSSFDPRLLFHDVMEHYFEGGYKYFEGENHCLIFGEMVAMGHAMYYYYVMGLYQIRKQSAYGGNFSDMCINTTFRALIEDMLSLEHGEYQFINPIPRQRVSKYSNHVLNEYIHEYWARLQATFKERGLKGKGLPKFSDIMSTHIYGFNMAQKMVPDNRHNLLVLIEFYDFLHEFLKNPDELEHTVESLVINLYREGENIEIEWLINKYPPFED